MSLQLLSLRHGVLMARLYAVEPWRLAVVGGSVALAYVGVPNSVSGGSNGPWLSLVSAVAAIDMLVGHCTRNPVFGGAGWLGWILGTSACVLGVLVRGIDPWVTALFATAIALLQLLVFWRAAHSLRLLAGSRPRLCAGLCWATMSLIVPPMAILAEGRLQTFLVFAWTLTAGLAAMLVLYRFTVLHPPVPPAASIETP